MLDQIGRLLRRAPTFGASGRCEHSHAERSDASHHELIVLDGAQANGDIDMLADQVAGVR